MQLIINKQVYPFPENFTFGEMKRIKVMTGMRAGQLYPALEEGDTDVIAAFAYIAMRRLNPSVKPDDVWALEVEDVEINDDDEQKDEPTEGEGEEGDEALPPAPDDDGDGERGAADGS